MSKKLLRKKLALMLATLKKKRKFFCELEYLESTGTQYIDTGLDYFADFEIGIQLRTNLSNKALGNGANYCMQRYNSANPYWYFSTGSGASNSYTSSTRITEYHVMKWKDNKIYADDVLLTDFTKDSNTPNRMYLFGVSSINRYQNVIYFCKLWNPDNGELVRDFIPVLDWDFVPCMYDRITGQFFYNAGTGTFSYGREIHYVDYIESSGTQYIDTGHAFTDDFSWEIDFEGLTKGATLFGGRTSSTRTALLYQKTAGQGVETACPIAGMTGDQTPFQLSDLSSNRHKVKMSVASNKGSVWVDGTQVYNNQSFSGTYISGTTQAIFADNFGSSVSEYTSSKFYGLKMWQGSTLVRDFVPAIDENGVGFVFNKVSHSCYLNAGTGAFKYPAREVEYLESSGTQYIDTGVMGNGEFSIKYRLYVNALGSNSDIFAGVGSSSQHLNFGQAASNGQFTIGYLNQYWMELSNFATNTHYDLEINYKSGEQYAVVNGIKGSSKTYTGTEQTNLTVYLFKRHHYGTDNVGGLQGRIYYFTMKQNDILVRDYIPCYKDGQAGMLDKVNSVFYQNNGTGTFTTGKIVEPEYE